MKSIKVKVEVITPTTIELDIIDEDKWRIGKNNFIFQCNAEKDMGTYMNSDYCEEEYGIRVNQDTIEEDIVNKEYGSILQVWDENGETV